MGTSPHPAHGFSNCRKAARIPILSSSPLIPCCSSKLERAWSSTLIRLNSCSASSGLRGGFLARAAYFSKRVLFAERDSRAYANPSSHLYESAHIEAISWIRIRNEAKETKAVVNFELAPQDMNADPTAAGTAIPKKVSKRNRRRSKSERTLNICEVPKQ